MVIGYHLILSTYGFWLPNDPRGSWSDFVRGWELRRYGAATKIDSHRSVAGADHDRELRLAAKRALSFPPVKFTGRQALAVAHGFDVARRESEYVIHACAILPDHTHMVIGATPHSIAMAAGHFKGRATKALMNEGLWGEDRGPVWSRGCWTVFLQSSEDVERAVEYVEGNPGKEGKPRQRWSFVTAYSQT